MPIIGNGDIASVLGPYDREGWLFFASGVSNSQETREAEYGREWKLLMDQCPANHLVYFSSLAIFRPASEWNRYIAHKQRMEVVVRERFHGHTIVRLGNITWGSNPHTLINFFRQQMHDGVSPTIEDAWRYIVDEEEFAHWMGLLPNFSCDLNIPGKRMKVHEVWKRYVGHRFDAIQPLPLQDPVQYKVPK